MQIRKRLLQCILFIGLLVASLPGANVTVRAENIREIKVHYTGDKTDISFHLWGDQFHSTQPAANWDTGSYLALTDGTYPYYVLKTVETDETWTLGAIVRHGDNKDKVYESDIMIPITGDVKDVYLGDGPGYSFDGQVENESPPPVDSTAAGRDSTFESSASDYIFINLLNENIDASKVTLWAWEDAHDDYREGSWDTDRLRPYEITDRFVTFKIGLIDDAQLLGFLFHYGDSQSQDFFFDVSGDVREVYLRRDDNNVYQDAEFSDIQVQSVKWVDVQTLQISFPGETTVGDLADSIELFKNGSRIDFEVKTIEKSFVQLSVNATDFSIKDTYTITIDDRKMSVFFDWRFIDTHYATEDALGTLWDGENVRVNFWSPSASSVELVVFDKANQDTVLDTLTMTEIDNVWTLELKPNDLGLDTLTNYYYQFKITRFAKSIYALDPYARSMAQWNVFAKPDNCDSSQSSCIGKAAFVNPANTAMTTDYAEIEGYESREDAIIYEVHVRDFTSDIALEGSLSAKFGTFAALVEKLDYIQSLGVTHIQLLPVTAYYNIDESNRDTRVWDALAQGKDSNYNWGYDPHSYFSLSGVYSEDNSTAELRVQEFKALIDEIHQRGMGVTMDVVFNHTAATHIFEDLQPNYYHFMDYLGTAKTSFGGGRLGTTHAMASRILTDAILYWVEEFKVDGFRFDMMGDHDATTIQKAYDLARVVNPNIMMIGEGWVTYAGDDDERVQAADQKWMKDTSAVGSFSDEFRNELKSGFGSEGQPRFITNGARFIEVIFNNIKAQPGNYLADQPQDVVNYIEAHDNLTLYDVISQSIKKDPKDAHAEILQRQRLGNFMVLTSQGTAFMQAGQEYGKTRQVIVEAYKEPVGACGTTMDEPIHKSTCMTKQDGTPFDYPYFIHDSYNSSDLINHFDWAKATDGDAYEDNVHTLEYTKGLIALRRSVDSFTLNSLEDIDKKVNLLEVEEQNASDLILAYSITDDDATYYVLINAAEQARSFTVDRKTEAAIRKADVLVDNKQAGTEAITEVSGLSLDDGITLEPLTGIVLRVENNSFNPFFLIVGVGILGIVGVLVMRKRQKSN